MDILKKAVLLVAILSISVFMAGCGGDDAAEDGGAEAQDAGGQTDSAGSGVVDDLMEKIEEGQEDKTEE